MAQETNTIISTKEYIEIKKKADQWDSLYDEISKFYCNKDGDYDEDNPEIQGDLCTIGEIAASALGWR